MVTKQSRPVPPEQVGQLTATRHHLAVIRRPMVGVTLEGTSVASFRGAPYVSGARPAPAGGGHRQGAKYNHATTEERHRDHALYIAYAPAEDPKIAIGMILENAGFGAAHAAPIARRAFDYYLLGLYPSEQDMALVRQGKATTPVGTPRPAAEFAWPPAPGPVAGAPTPPASAGALPLAAATPGAVPGAMFAAAFLPQGAASAPLGAASAAEAAAAAAAAPAAAAAAARARAAAPLRAPPARSSGGRATPAAPGG